jgi:hypothetical protein
MADHSDSQCEWHADISLGEQAHAPSRIHTALRIYVSRTHDLRPQIYTTRGGNGRSYGCLGCDTEFTCMRTRRGICRTCFGGTSTYTDSPCTCKKTKRDVANAILSLSSDERNAEVCKILNPFMGGWESEVVGFLTDIYVTLDDSGCSEHIGIFNCPILKGPFHGVRCSNGTLHSMIRRLTRPTQSFQLQSPGTFVCGVDGCGL